MTTPSDTQPQAPAATITGNSLALKRTLRATPERVFEAWTRPDLVCRWLSPGEMGVDEAEFDVRVGGSYRIVMMSPAGESHSPSGIYEEIVPNEKLVFSWQWAGSDRVTRVTVELRPVGSDQTELTLTHEGFADSKEREDHQKGWNGCLVKLPGALAT